MDRRSLLDDDEAAEALRGSVFGDEHETQDFDFVADGFRPTQQGAAGSAAGRDGLVTGGETAQHALPTNSQINARNSIRKSRNLANPFTSPEDVEDGLEEPHPSLHFELDESSVRRSVSSASSAVYARTHSPRFGASAMPSHPYNMYPQGTQVRSSTLTTTSAAVSTRHSLSARTGPQHPYAMYPQGIDDDHDHEDEDVDLTQQNPVPVGFAGVGNSYRRQVGPDGEEQDIIGSDGHAEQLPPYSRYPEDGPEKMPLMPTALHSRAPVHGSNPGMALMHAALQPSSIAQSMTDASELEPLQSTPELTLLNSRSSRSIYEDDPEKSWSEKSWRERSKTRVCCGVRLWWILAIFAAILFVLALVGGVAGGYLAGSRSQGTAPIITSNSFPIVTVVTSLYDASLIPTPTAGAPPTGTFALTLSTPAEIQSACLVSQNQQVAWDCDIVPNHAIAINVTMNNGSLGANIFYASTDKSLVYGAQAQDMVTPFAQFLAVRDNDAPDNGPAYYFAQTYNKVVIVPQDAFDPDEKKFKRYDYNAEVSPNTIAPGSFPWFCVWNNTLLEGFIYIEKQAKMSSAATSAPSLTASATSTTAAPSSPQPSSFTTTASFGPGASAVFTGASSEFASWMSVHRAQATDRASGSNSNSGNQARQAASDPWSQYARYPYSIKLEERRTPGSSSSTQAYCQQYQVLWDGHANWRPSPSDQKPIKVWLDEQDPAYAAYKSTGIAVGGRNRRRGGDVVSTGCHCQWTSGM